MGISYSPRIVTDGLVLALDAANPKSYPGSGTTWKDLSGNENNGTLTNGPTFDSGNGGSISFDGVDDSAVIPKESDPSPNPFTAFLWFKENRTTSYSFSHLIDNLSYTNDIGWHSSIARYSPYLGQVSFRYVDYTRLLNDSVFLILSTHENLDDGNWHMATYSWDGTTNTNAVKLYIDGELSQSGTSALTNTTRQDDIRLGTGNHGNGTPFLGNVSNFTMYNRILTPQEIQQNYNATKPRYNL